MTYTEVDRTGSHITESSSEGGPEGLDPGDRDSRRGHFRNSKYFKGLVKRTMNPRYVQTPWGDYMLNTIRENGCIDTRRAARCFCAG
ncbi:MAG: hypothetical protein A2Z14_07850 [Chloroflexi bacterium RBG_16_48_8]|nr:MAG: hypothetical protein A2Z14_07850 [Chloroflexi bacterium RBG_16_48_8]